MESVEERRTSLVTGGTEGIGRAVCVELARRGDRVLFVGRDQRRADAVLAELRAVSSGVEHMFVRADLSLLSETARVAEEIERRASRLDALVACAGILSTIPEWTAEGLERNLVLNYLTRYLLARRLLPKLLAGPSGRIVLVSNAGRYEDTLDFDDLQHRSGKSGLAVAGRTQFANDLFAVELAERLRGTPLEVTCVFPGVTRTRVFENARGLPWFLRVLAPLFRMFAHSAETAAITPVFLARDAAAAGTSGRFFGPHRKEIRVPERASSVERRRLLWDASELLVRDQLRDDALRNAPHVALRSEPARDRPGATLP
ncbi:MAG TPA: SDR family NAD(P)-dependent oxidoreductase [Polyangiaceae bacterium]